MNGINKTTGMERVNTWFGNASIGAIAASAVLTVECVAGSAALGKKSRKKSA